MRNLPIGKGITRTESLGNQHGRIFRIRAEHNERLTSTADEINSLGEEIRLLYNQIVSTQGGDTRVS